MKKFRRPKMSLHRPATVVTTAAARDHAVAVHAIVVDGPMSASMVSKIADGRTNEKRHASYVNARACHEPYKSVNDE